MKKLSFLIYFLIFALTACTNQSNTDCSYYSNIDQLNRDYQNAVIDVIIPDENRIYSPLMEIKTPDSSPQQEWITENGRKMILVTTFIKKEVLKYWMEDEPFIVKVDCWVSVPSEWSKFKIDFTKLDDKADRIRMLQLLGMPPEASNSIMIEFYADAEKIFRPSKDPETYDDVASLKYPENTAKEYIAWFENQKEQAYKSVPGFPFTQLGYSYDWSRNSENHVGLSEFVVPKGTLVKVKTRMDYQEFLKEIK